MKLLLDECMPLDFRHCFPQHEVHSAEWADLKGKKNGELIRAAEAAGYQVLLTVDQGLPRRQNLRGRTFSVILLRSRTSQLEDLLPLVGLVLVALEKIEPGEVLIVA